MSEQANWDVVIVGGGIVGAATLYKMQARFPDLRILLLEKEKALADHQTGHNSGVIHSGIYYKPGSYKARNCVTGRRELVAFAREHGVEHDVCGKLIVATDKEELPRLEKIYNTGVANGIEGMERVTPEQIREIEPYCEGIAGVRVSTCSAPEAIRMRSTSRSMLCSSSATSLPRPSVRTPCSERSARPSRPVFTSVPDASGLPGVAFGNERFVEAQP
ncbi:MAG: FAD-dependent oxidoreductase, partial [Flavobacteriales bacterium]